MTDLATIRQRIEYAVDTAGLDKLAASADKAAAATGKLSGAAASSSTSVEQAQKSAISVSKALDAYTKAMDPATAALSKLERGERLISTARSQGLPVSESAVRAVQNARTRYLELAKATDEHSKSLGLNRVQAMESIHVAKSLADSIIAGASPMRALAVEGGRIAQIFSEGSGGVGGTLKAMGATVGRLAFGWAGLATGIVGGLALAGAAVARFQSQQDKLALSLNGSGRATGLSLADITGVANAAGARNPALGQSGATAAAASFASTGKISGALMPGLLDLTASYARGTGQDAAKASEELAKAFADPAKGADQLNEKLGFLDFTTKRHIESLERQGDLLGAQQTLLTKAAAAAAGMADRTWSIAGAWAKIEGAVAGTFTAAGGAIEHAVNGSTPEEHVAALAKQRRSLASNAGTIWSRPGATADVTEDILQMRRGIIDPARNTASTAAADKRANDLSIQIGEAVTKSTPDLDRSQELSKTLSLIDKALGDPAVLSKIEGGPDGLGAGAVGIARARTANQLAYSDPLKRIQQDSALSVQGAEAQTGAQRTLVEARRAELEVLRSTGDATQAAAKSLAAWNDAIAKSNAEADDALRAANRRAGMIGLSPLQRGAAEIRARYDDMARNAVTGIPAGALVAPAGAAGGGSYRDRISAIESGGNYGALGPVTKSGDRAYGKYQVMGSNVGPWTEAVYGRAMTPAQFLADHAAQDKVFDHQFGGYVDKYGPANASSMWLTGRTLANGGATARDQNGTSGGAYASAFASGSPRVGAYAPAAALAPFNLTVPSSSAATRGRSLGVDLGAYYDEQTTEKLRGASDELERNQALLDLRTKSIGASTEATQKAIHALENWNSLQLKNGDLTELGTDRVNKLKAANDDLATRQTAYDQQQQQQQRQASASNWFQQTGDSAVGTLGTDAGDLFNANPRNLVGQLKIGDQAKYYAGQMSGSQVKQKIFMGQAGNFARNLMFQQGIGMVQKGLFGSGQMGQPGYQSGLLGGVFNGITGGLFGGGSKSSGGGGLFGNLFGGLFGGGSTDIGDGANMGNNFNNWMFADGGVMTARGPLPLRKYAMGGVASSPQVAVYGEGKGAEAYVPLPDGRSIPVALKGGGGGAPSIQMGGHTIVVQGSADDKAISQMRAELAASNRQMMTDLQRNFGAMSAKWQQRVGA